MNKRLSIIIPVINEERTLEALVSRVEEVRIPGWDKEVILIDDGSTDGSGEIIARFAKKHKIIKFDRNYGKGRAVREGLKVATGEVVVIQDADWEYDPQDLVGMLAKMEKEKCQVVYGSREREKVGWGAGVLNYLFNFLHATRLSDVYTGYKVFARDAVDPNKLESDGFEIEVELTDNFAKNGSKIAETPIGYAPRTIAQGKKISWQDGVRAVAFMTRIWLVVGVIVAAHITFLNNGFIWLDHGDIERGRTILPLNRLHEAFIIRLGETGFYRPVITIVNSVNWAIWGRWAPGYHIVNALMHTLAAVTAGVFVSKFWKLNKNEQLGVSLIAGLHPIGWVAVGAISYLQDPLVTLLVMLTIVRYAEKKIVMAGVFAGLAVLTKETGGVWIVALVLTWEVVRNNSFKKINWRFLGIFALVCATYLGLRGRAIPEKWLGHGVDLSYGQALGTRMLSWGRLVGFLGYPFLPPLSDAARIVGWGYGLIGLVVAITMWKSPKNWRSWEAMIVILTFPAINIVPVPRFFSAHYGYAASMVVGMGAVWMMRKSQIAKWLIVGWLIVAGITTFAAGSRFRNDVTLFEPEAKKHREFLEGRLYLGDYYKSNKYYEEALDPVTGYIAFVDKTAVKINLGVRYAEEGNIELADKTFVEAYAESAGSNREKILYDRAVLHFKAGNCAKVLQVIAEWGETENATPVKEACLQLGGIKSR